MRVRRVILIPSFPLPGWATSDASRESNEEDHSTYDLSLPEVTLSANDKTGQEGSTIPVLRQRSFIGRVLPFAVADVPCTVLGVQGVLEKLNVLDSTPGSPRYEVWEYFVANESDLGTAYAHLCYQPHNMDIDEHITEARKDDEKMRRDLLEKREIGKHAPPRRIWDLRANRVVPWWVAGKCAWAISHAWVSDDDLKYEMTSINGYEWPLPMPKNADLDLIRIEMLNLSAEYIWLDVLCLRQKGQGNDPRGNTSQVDWDRREILCKEEWKVDLPIIGWVYHNARQVAVYLSGLDLPLSFRTKRDFEDKRCWFKRAWTLQETRHDVVIAGRTCGDDKIDGRFIGSQELFKLLIALHNLERIQQQMTRTAQILHFLAEMQRWESSNPVDKVAGLVFLLQLKHIPIYNADQCEEDAWTELLNVADGELRATFFFLYPKPNGMKSWRPSWQQLMTETFPNFPKAVSGSIDVSHVHWTKEDGDWYDGPRMEACHVRGLADKLHYAKCGTLNVENSSGEEYAFQIFADPGCTMPDGQYTLLGVVANGSAISWVVGEIEEPEGKFRKMLEVWMNDNEAERLQSHNIYEVTKTFLL